MEQLHHKFVILGSGPGGIQLAYFLQQQGADYLVLDRASAPASSFTKFPRHRTLISNNKLFTGSDDAEFNMRHDWNSLLCDDDDFRLKNYDKKYFPCADSFVSYMTDFVGRYDINVRYSTNVVEIDRQGKHYILRDDNDTSISCEILIVATGVSKPNIPMIDGIELTENYVDMSLDLEEFENQRVLIIGKKNSAFETADHLVPSAALIHICSPSSIRMAWKTHYVGDLRAVNNNFLDTYQLKSQNAVLDADILSIAREGDQLRVTFKYQHAEDEVEEIVYDRVLCCAGFKFDASIFTAAAKPELAYMGKYPNITPGFESVNQPHMYFAGTLTHSLDYRKATSGFIHGFRYNSRALFKLLSERHLGIELPKQQIPADSEAIAQQMLNRVNRAGGLWQQPGFIADVAVRKDGEFLYIEELPREYIRNSIFEESDDLYVLTLEYGAPIMGDPFAVERIHRENVQEASASQFLHPVIRRYMNGVLVAKHEIIEDLEAKWVEPEHYAPLTAFFDEQIPIQRPVTRIEESTYS